MAVNWRQQGIEVNLPPVMKRRGIDFVGVPARRVHPAESRVELEDGRLVPYDYLVIATGPDLAFDEIAGLGPAANRSPYATSITPSRQAAFEAFCKAPGPIVVGAVQGATASVRPTNSR